MSRPTRARILDATFDVVAEVGLSGLALEDVARTAGVSRQTLYRHFGSRERLVEALLLREEQWFIDRVVAAAEPCESAEEAIAKGAAAALRAATEHKLLHRLLETDPGAILPLVVLGRGPVISVARPVVMQLLSARLTLPDDEVEQLADVCSRLLVSYVLDPSPEPPDVVGGRIARMALRSSDRLAPP
jgi:AcrR family transcriptional regulator